MIAPASHEMSGFSHQHHNLVSDFTEELKNLRSHTVLSVSPRWGWMWLVGRGEILADGEKRK